MKFYAKSLKGTVITDDYSEEEIKKELHIKNILEDFRRHFSDDFCVDIYDENNKIVRRVFLYSM